MGIEQQEGCLSLLVAQAMQAQATHQSTGVSEDQTTCTKMKEQSVCRKWSEM
jgi:hypothetical protein